MPWYITGLCDGRSEGKTATRCGEMCRNKTAGEIRAVREGSSLTAKKLQRLAYETTSGFWYADLLAHAVISHNFNNGAWRKIGARFGEAIMGSVSIPHS